MENNFLLDQAHFAPPRNEFEKWWQKFPFSTSPFTNRNATRAAWNAAIRAASERGKKIADMHLGDWLDSDGDYTAKEILKLLAEEK